jgi:hypothetical protein
MNKIGKKILFLGAGLLFLSSNLDAAARRQAAPKKKTPAARVDNKRVERKADDKKAAECSICLDPLKSMPVQATACMHTFHRQCLNQWLERNPRCPECRTNLNPQAYGLIRAAQAAPRRADPAPMRVNRVARRHNNQAGQNIQNLPGPLRWCLYAVLCCLRCPRAPENLVRR